MNVQTCERCGSDYLAGRPGPGSSLCPKCRSGVAAPAGSPAPPAPPPPPTAQVVAPLLPAGSPAPGGRLDPGPLVGSDRGDAVVEALAGLPVAGATGVTMNPGDDLTGAFLVPLGLTGGDPKTGLVIDPTGSGAGNPGRATFMGVE